MAIVNLAGRLGGDPVHRVTPQGQKLVELNVATRGFANGAEETIWWRVTVWENVFKTPGMEATINLLKKGSAVLVTAKMRSKPRTYLDKEGRTQISLEVQALSVEFSPSGGDRTNAAGGPQQYQAKAPAAEPQPAFTTGMAEADTDDDNNDEEVPF